MEKLTTEGTLAYGPYALGTSAYAPTLAEWPGGGVVGSMAPTNLSSSPVTPPMDASGCATPTSCASAPGEVGTPIDII